MTKPISESSARQNIPANNSRPTGSVLRVSGTIIDVQFPREAAPTIFNELHITIPANGEHKETTATLEVEQQLGDGAVRCVAIDNVFGISRGLPVIDTGAPITVPVGPQVLGRIVNVLTCG